MSQRNPLNERYQNTDERTGKTRKSAASAKPATKAAASVRIQGKSEEPKGLLARATQRANKSEAVKNSKKKTASKAQVERRREQALRSKYYNPDTPEYKKWRRVWWVMLGGAIISTSLSFYASNNETIGFLTYPLVALSYILLLLAIIFEFTFIRRLRTEYQDKMIALEKSKKNSTKRKEAAARARLEAEAAQDAEPEEKRKLFSGLFTKKRAQDAVATAKNAQARAAQGTEEADAGADADAGTDEGAATETDAAKKAANE